MYISEKDKKNNTNRNRNRTGRKIGNINGKTPGMKQEMTQERKERLGIRKEVTALDLLISRKCDYVSSIFASLSYVDLVIHRNSYSLSVKVRTSTWQKCFGGTLPNREADICILNWAEATLERKVKQSLFPILKESQSLIFLWSWCVKPNYKMVWQIKLSSAFLLCLNTCC